MIVELIKLLNPGLGLRYTPFVGHRMSMVLHVSGAEDIILGVVHDAKWVGKWVNHSEGISSIVIALYGRAGKPFELADKMMSNERENTDLWRLFKSFRSGREAKFYTEEYERDILAETPEHFLYIGSTPRSVVVGAICPSFSDPQFIQEFGRQSALEVGGTQSLSGLIASDVISLGNIIESRNGVGM
jgi:hypothetical protein